MLSRPFSFSSIGVAAVILALGAADGLRAEPYAVTSIAGSSSAAGSADGTAATFNNPYGVAIDANKNLYVADTLNHTIRKISPAHVVLTLAGSPGVFGTTDGSGPAARFNFPTGVAVDSAGNIYVADLKNSVVRKITSAGVVSTYAGAALQFGSTDGATANARFFLPRGVAVDSGGNVYVADSGNHTIRKITAAGAVLTLAGFPGAPGLLDGSGSAARFNNPTGVAVDAGGNVYVADADNNAIRKITAAGAVTTITGGGPSTAGAIDGAVATARLNGPQGIAVDASGNLYIAEDGNSVIRFISGGQVSTIAGTAGINGAVDSVGAAAAFYDPRGIAVDGTTIYVADSSNNLIRQGVPASTASLANILSQPLNQTVNAGQSVTLGVIASGSGLTYQWLKSGNTISGATSPSYTIPSAQAGDVAAYTVRIGSTGGTIDSGQANLTVVPAGSGPITSRPLSQAVNAGQAATFSVSTSGAASYQWSKNGTAIAGATNSTYAIGAVQANDAGTYGVSVVSGGSSETASATLVVLPAGTVSISITTQPASQTVSVGQSVSFTVGASGGGLTYQWLKNGGAIAGAIGTSYTIASAQAADAGNYSARVSGSGGSVDSATAILAVSQPSGPTARLSNLSVRTTLTANQSPPFTVGFVVSGGSRNILVRAGGPALAAFGLPNTIADPRIDLYQDALVVASNDNWDASLTSVFSSVGAFPYPAGSKDAALQQGVDGGRTVQVTGTGGGLVLVEAYDTGAGNSPRMINLSARNQVGTGTDILIAGFTVTGTGTKQLLIRGVGPGLAVFGVPGTLADPQLELYDSSGTTILAQNDNWDGSAALTSAMSNAGAFAIAAGSKDAAMLVSLPASPGGTGYTVEVKGAGGSTGVALVEVYEVQ